MKIRENFDSVFLLTVTLFINGRISRKSEKILSINLIHISYPTILNPENHVKPYPKILYPENHIKGYPKILYPVYMDDLIQQYSYWK